MRNTENKLGEQIDMQSTGLFVLFNDAVSIPE